MFLQVISDMVRSDRSRKRAKTNKDGDKSVKKRRGAGKLSLIMTIPIDVFCEVRPIRHFFRQLLIMLFRLLVICLPKICYESRGPRRA